MEKSTFCQGKSLFNLPESLAQFPYDCVSKHDQAMPETLPIGTTFRRRIKGFLVG
jgi:hypothetical protein